MMMAEISGVPRGEAAVSAMHDQVRKLFFAQKKLSSDQKIEQIRKSFRKRHFTNSEYEIDSANLLKKLQEEGEITNWFASKNQSFLDQLQVDKIIMVGDYFVPFQETSDARLVDDRVNKIMKIYQLTPKAVVPVIQHRDYMRRKISEEMLRFRILTVAKEGPRIYLNVHRQNSQSLVSSET